MAYYQKCMLYIKLQLRKPEDEHYIVLKLTFEYIPGDSNHTAWHESNQWLSASKETSMWTSIAKRHTESLAGSNRDVHIKLTWRTEQC
jgi:hypothetical protein